MGPGFWHGGFVDGGGGAVVTEIFEAHRPSVLFLIQACICVDGREGGDVRTQRTPPPPLDPPLSRHYRQTIRRLGSRNQRFVPISNIDDSDSLYSSLTFQLLPDDYSASRPTLRLIQVYSVRPAFSSVVTAHSSVWTWIHTFKNMKSRVRNEIR